MKYTGNGDAEVFDLRTRSTNSERGGLIDTHHVQAISLYCELGRIDHHKWRLVACAAHTSDNILQSGPAIYINLRTLHCVAKKTDNELTAANSSNLNFDFQNSVAATKGSEF